MSIEIKENKEVSLEKGEEKEVKMVKFEGKRLILGLKNMVDGWRGEGKKKEYKKKREIDEERDEKIGFKQ